MLGVQSSAPVSSTAQIDRRRGQRFPLQLSCRLYRHSMEAALEGTVVNISRSGILVALDSAPILGALRPDQEARVVVDLPRHPMFSPRCLECAVTVVRVVLLKARAQVAVEI